MRVKLATGKGWFQLRTARGEVKGWCYRWEATLECGHVVTITSKPVLNRTDEQEVAPKVAPCDTCGA